MNATKVVLKFKLDENGNKIGEGVPVPNTFGECLHPEITKRYSFDKDAEGNWFKYEEIDIKDEEEDDYEATHKIANQLEKKYNKKVKNTDRPNIHFCFDDEDMKKVVSRKKPITIVITKTCYCFDEQVGFLPAEPTTRIPVEYKRRPITNKTCCEALVKSDWLCCNHLFVEHFSEPDENGEVQVFLGS